MKRIYLAAAFVIASFGWQPGLAQELPRIVVLLNGNLVVGQVERHGDTIEVNNGPWHSLRIPTVDVDFISPDLPAAYRVKLERLRPNDVTDQLRLAQWCLRYDLDACAAERLLHLTRIAPQHPAVRALDQQLQDRAKLALEGPPEIQAVSVSEPLPTPDAAAAASLPVPAEGVAQFTRSIQPLLLNRCGQSTCHGNAARNDFHLTKLAPGGATRKELTLRNLRAVSRLINSANPDESELLLQANTAHGGANQPPLESHDLRQRQRLLEWVALMTHHESTDEAAAPPPPAAPAALSLRDTTATPLARLQQAAVDSSAQATPKGADTPSADETLPIAGETLPTMPATVSTDPFDPAEFNKRFGTEP